MNHVLIKPIITEKTMKLAQWGSFTFEVDVNSNKIEIAQAVAAAFKVNPISVQTITIGPKTKRVGKRRQETITSPRKKAIVSLKTGQKIDLFDVTEGKHQHA